MHNVRKFYLLNTSEINALGKELIDKEKMEDFVYPIVLGIINNGMENFYSVAENILTKTDFKKVVDLSIEVIILSNIVQIKSERLYSLFTKKFREVTDDFAISLLLQKIVDSKTSQLYLVFEEKFRELTNDFEIRLLLEKVVDSKTSQLYPVFKEKFRQLKDEKMVIEVLNRIIVIGNEKQLKELFDVVEEKIKGLKNKEEADSLRLQVLIITGKEINN